MAKSVKEYFVEQGMPGELAAQLDEVTLAMQGRIRRFNKRGVSKQLIMIDIGKYRHMETRSPNSIPEMNRVLLDAMLLTLNFAERIRILEHYKIIKLNYLTGEYEFTDIGKQLVETAKV